MELAANRMWAVECRHDAEHSQAFNLFEHAEGHLEVGQWVLGGTPPLAYGESMPNGDFHADAVDTEGRPADLDRWAGFGSPVKGPGR